MSITAICFSVFFASIIAGMFGICYLAHRFEAQFDWLLDQWWGLPTSIIGAPMAIFGLAFAAATLVEYIA